MILIMVIEITDIRIYKYILQRLMDLIEILDRILKTKNQMRDILGETNNISRYPIAIHNNIAVKYNRGYVQGYYDRYYELNNSEYWVSGPMTIYEYGVDATYYEEYTTEVLTDIMRDCLNYRLGMKDELDIDSDEFVTYPDYLRDKIDSVYDIGYAAGKDQADEDYEGNEDVYLPTVTNDRNKISMSTSQAGARIKYKINSEGLEYEYTSPIIISENCTIYVKAILGRSVSDWVTLSCTFDPDGFISFITPPSIKQEGNLIYLSTSMNNTTIEYEIDNKGWNVYTHAISVTQNDSILYCKALRNGEYSATVAQPISHASSLTRPANVRCVIEDLGAQRKITLSCETSGTEIRYAINQNTGDFFLYSTPVYTEDEHFIVYAYSIKNGEESPNRLYWKFDKNETTVPQAVHFTDNGKQLIMDCVSENSVIYYRYGDVGGFINGGSNYVVISPADGANIQAYSSLNGTNSSIYYHTFHLTESAKIEKPYAYLDANNYIIITSSYQVFYTLDGTDPKTGLSYGSPIHIDNTVTLKCVAKSGGYFSDEAIYTFSVSGSNVTPGGGGTGGGSVDSNKDWFWMTGCDRITYSGTALYYSDGTSWKRVEDSTRFNAGIKTYFYGNDITRFTPMNGNPNIGGDILSLKIGKNFDSVASYTGSFENFFSGSTVTNAVDLNLRLTTVSSGQYKGMFMNCNKLLSAPQLPAVSVGQRGYMAMFSGCSSLVTAPNLPSVSLSSSCYESMFEGCSNLVNVPSLSCVSLIDSCYKAMFRGCIALKNAPYLPAVNMVGSCYESMFEGCSSLETAPELPCENLAGVVDCYKRMFYGCGRLNYIKAMFKNRPTGNFSNNWVYGVASSGTFVKNTDATWTDTGVNAVPVGWTVRSDAPVGNIVLIEYLPNIGRIRILASNGDDIYYSFDNNACNLLYNDSNRPVITKSCDVYARCYNGVQYGSIYSIHIDVSYPALVATVYNRQVSISAAGYTYDMIKYVLVEYEADIQDVTESDFITYNGPFNISSDWYIVMRGYISGQSGYVTQSTQYLIANLSAPVIDLYKNVNNTRTYIKISYPTPSMNPVIYWSLNDSENVTNIYSDPIQVTWYNDEQTKVYYAKAEVTYNGSRVWTSVVSKTVSKGDEGSSVTLSVPNLYQLDNTSNWWYVEYEGTRYTVWDNTTVNIGYRFELGGNTRIYYSGINLRDMPNPPLSDTTVNVYVWAYTDNINKSEEHHYVCTYHADSGATEPNTPTINFVSTGSQYKIYVSNDTSLQQYDTIVNYYWMEEPSEWTADALTTGIKYNQWVQISDQGDLISNYIVKTRFKAKSVVWWSSTGSNESIESDWYEFNNDFAVTAIPTPTGEVKKENGHNVLYLYSSMNENEMYTRQFYIENTKWASGAVDTTIYDSWNEAFIYGTQLSDYLGEGTIHIRYSSHGLISEEYSFYWKDDSIVTGLVEPTIVISDMDGGRHKVMITNTVNSMVQLQYRIINTVWAGGVTDRTQYDNWKVTFTTGIVLNEYIISGTLQARTWDGESYSEISEYPFAFEYNGIPNPTISFVDKGTYHEILVSNKNKYVTSYYRWEGSNSYSVANKYGNSISSSILSGYAYAYSILDTDRSSTVISYFDSGISTTYTAPTITVIPNGDGITYNMSISFDQNLPRILWKIEPTDWDGATQFTSQYVGDTNTGWLVQSKSGNQTVFSKNLDQYLKKGTIQAFVTNATNSIQSNIDTSNNSEVTTYSFVNGHYSS